MSNAETKISGDTLINYSFFKTSVKETFFIK